jgi:hypothetical protein
LLPDENAWIQQYRLIQEREDRIVLQVVSFSSPSAEQVAMLKDQIRALLGPGMEVDVALMPCLPLEPSGKFRVCRSLVRSHYDGIEWDMRGEERR